MANPKSIPPEVAAALKAGNKIQAIKLLRERMGSGGGLAEAKSYIEGLQALRDELPPSPTHSSDHMPAQRRATVAPRPRPSGYVQRDGLSPGEVPRTSGSTQATFVVIAIAVAIAVYIAFS